MCLWCYSDLKTVCHEEVNQYVNLRVIQCNFMSPSHNENKRRKNRHAKVNRRNDPLRTWKRIFFLLIKNINKIIISPFPFPFLKSDQSSFLV